MTASSWTSHSVALEGRHTAETAAGRAWRDARFACDAVGTEP